MQANGYKIVIVLLLLGVGIVAGYFFFYRPDRSGEIILQYKNDSIARDNQHLQDRVRDLQLSLKALYQQDSVYSRVYEQNTKKVNDVHKQYDDQITHLDTLDREHIRRILTGQD